MLTAINTILEMAATLICVNYLFGKRYYFSIYDAVFMVAEVTLKLFWAVQGDGFIWVCGNLHI